MAGKEQGGQGQEEDHVGADSNRGIRKLKFFFSTRSSEDKIVTPFAQILASLKEVNLYFLT